MIMKKLISVVFILAFQIAHAQNVPRIVMHLQSSDTMVYRSMVNQISNIKKQLPDAEVEIVCHGPGLEFLLNRTTDYSTRIQKMNLANVTFVGCEFTMKQRNVSKDDLVPFAKTVPFGLVEIIKKQQEDWLYVKLGF